MWQNLCTGITLLYEYFPLIAQSLIRCVSVSPASCPSGCLQSPQRLRYFNTACLFTGILCISVYERFSIPIYPLQSILLLLSVFVIIPDLNRCILRPYYYYDIPQLVGGFPYVLRTAFVVCSSCSTNLREVGLPSVSLMSSIKTLKVYNPHYRVGQSLRPSFRVHSLFLLFLCPPA